MRANHHHKTTLLVTDDPALERAARDVAKDLGNVLQPLKDSHEAMCVAFDAFARETVAIVDVDAEFGSHAMINAIAGLVPVIAVTAKSKRWLRSMLRRHRIHAEVSKPVSPEALKRAVFRVRDFYGNDPSFDR